MDRRIHRILDEVRVVTHEQPIPIEKKQLYGIVQIVRVNAMLMVNRIRCNECHVSLEDTPCSVHQALPKSISFI
ncbi:MAG: hypothetical protein EPO64_01975 [Nitrospirae bacterium]|nr:MAG: hypothetical protein EPO64_01975 [Nitrospirota bacterium]